jgi:hypothetical protein
VADKKSAGHAYAVYACGKIESETKEANPGIPRDGGTGKSRLKIKQSGGRVPGVPVNGMPGRGKPEGKKK